MKELLIEVAAYINQLLDLQLSPDLKFHNKSHTVDVVEMRTGLGS